MAETLSLAVKEVDGPNAQGWFEVVFEDDSKASTKSEELAKAAFQSRGTIADVVVSRVTKGKYTNVYLNEINGVKDSPKPRAKTASNGAAPRTPETQERIARQWAYGRSIELLIASDSVFEFPLTSEQMSALSDQATALVNATK